MPSQTFDPDSRVFDQGPTDRREKEATRIPGQGPSGVAKELAAALLFSFSRR